MERADCTTFGILDLFVSMHEIPLSEGMTAELANRIGVILHACVQCSSSDLPCRWSASSRSMDVDNVPHCTIA